MTADWQRVPGESLPVLRCAGSAYPFVAARAPDIFRRACRKSVPAIPLENGQPIGLHLSAILIPVSLPFHCRATLLARGVALSSRRDLTASLVRMCQRHLLSVVPLFRVARRTIEKSIPCYPFVYCTLGRTWLFLLRGESATPSPDSYPSPAFGRARRIAQVEPLGG